MRIELVYSPSARCVHRVQLDLPPGAEIPLIHGEIPPREVLLRFIADHPDKASKREISKEFGLKGEKRVELKQILKSFEEEGLLEKRRKSLVRPGALPPVAVLDITTRDVTGDLIGRPAEWLDSAKDIANTLIMPTIILLTARLSGIFRND